MGGSPLTLVCFAVREEARFFPEQFHARTDIRVLVTGMGARNAADRIQSELAANTPSLVMTCGFAGGLNPELPACSLVFSEDEDAGLGSRLRALGAVPGRFHRATRVATTRAEKESLRRSTGADAVEMESQIIRDHCRERGIPSATIRVISDTAREDLALDFNVLMTPEMKISFARLAWQLVKSPGKIPALLALQKRTDAAARKLGDVLGTLLARPL